MKKWVVGLVVIGMMVVPAFAHPGGTDGSGGHYNRSTGEYHYHHGYGAHDHVDGVCPYDYDDKAGERSGSSGGSDGGYSYSPSTAYAASYKSSDWFPEYTAAKAELKRAKSAYFAYSALSAIVGLCGGLIVHVRRSRKQLQEQEKWLLRQAENAVEQAKQKVEQEWSARLQEAERRVEETERKLTNERHEMQTERLQYEENRRKNSLMFLEMARRAPDEEQRNAYLSKVVQNALPASKEGLVYVPKDLNTGIFHREYAPCGVRHMVLASKKNLMVLGFKQCPECVHAAQPTGDPIVYAAPSNTHVYHTVDAFCAGYSAREIPMSEALARGLRPCSKCYPPKEMPKVWF